MLDVSKTRRFRGRLATAAWAAIAVTAQMGAGCSDDSASDLRPGGSTPEGDSSTDGGNNAAGDGSKGDAGSDSSTTIPPLVYAFVGHANEGWIQVYEISAAGEWSFKSKLTGVGEVSWLDVDTARGHLFANDGVTGKIRSFAFDKATGEVTALPGMGQATGGTGATHHTLDPSGKWIFVAHYTSGHVTVLPVAADGTVGAAVDTEFAGAQAHWAGMNPSGGFVFAPCVGANAIARYSVDLVTGALTPLPSFSAGLGGPRHLAFHPSEKFAYAINEPSSSISALTFDKATGAFGSIETKTTLPAGFMGSNSGAEIEMHPSGKFVFGSNRPVGSDGTIVSFAVNATDGKLTLVGHTTTGGQTPRSFAITPDGKYLYAGNEGFPGSVFGMSIDQTSGALTSLGQTPSTGIPTVVRIYAFQR